MVLGLAEVCVPFVCGQDMQEMGQPLTEPHLILFRKEVASFQLSSTSSMTSICLFKFHNCTILYCTAEILFFIINFK